MCERFLAVDMPSRFERLDGRHSVGVVGRADHDGLNVLLVKELSEVVVFLSCWELLRNVTEILVVDIANSDDVLALDTIDVCARTVRDAHQADIELLVGRFALGKDGPASHPKAGCSKGGAFEKLTSSGFSVHEWALDVEKGKQGTESYFFSQNRVLVFTFSSPT